MLLCTRRVVFVTGLLLLLCSHVAQAQLPQALGTEFWLGFPEHDPPISGSSSSLRVILYARGAATATVSQPAGAFTQTVNLAAGATQVVTLSSATFMTTGSESAQDRAVRVLVTAGDSIAVWAESRFGTSGELTQVAPVQALGSRYYCATVPATGVSTLSERLGQLLVVSLQNGTQVQITPTASTIGGRTAGAAFTITLNAGQVYQVQGTTGSDLTGTLVRTTAASTCSRIAVFSSSQWQSVCGSYDVFGDLPLPFPPGTCRNPNHMFEQMLPTTLWGSRYTVAPSSTRDGDLIRIISDTDGNQITLDGGAPVAINRGEPFDLVVGAPTVIQSSSPVGVFQYGQSAADDNNTTGAPFLTQVQPALYGAKRLYVLVPPNLPDITSRYIRLVTHQSAVASVRVNGAAITGFAAVPGDATQRYVELVRSAALYTVTCDSVITATSYGFGTDRGYGFAALGQLVPSLSYTTNLSGDTTTCTGLSIRFAARQNYPFAAVRWVFSDGVTQTGATVNRAFTQVGTYRVRLEVDQIGACRTDTLSQSFTVTSLAVTPVKDYTICPGVGTPLATNSLSGASSYSWSPATGLSSATVASPTATPTTNTTYTVAVTIAGGCVYTDTVRVTVRPQLFITLPSRDTTICQNATIPFQSSVVGDWSRSAGPAGTFATGTNSTSQSFPALGTFTITFTDGICSVTRRITVVDRPTIVGGSVPTVQNYCTPAGISFNSDVNGTWQLTDITAGTPATTVGTDVATLSLQTIVVPEHQYQIRVDACGQSTTRTFNVWEQPISSPAIDTIVRIGQAFRLRSSFPGRLVRTDSRGTVTVGSGITQLDTLTLVAGPNTFVIQNANFTSCQTRVVVYGVRDSARITAATNPACTGRPVTLTSAEVGYWYLSRGGVETQLFGAGNVAITNTITYTPTTAGTDIVYNRQLFGPQASRTLTVRTTPNITGAGVAAKTLNLCADEPLNLSAGTNSVWTLVNGTTRTALVPGSPSSVTNYLFAATGTYRVVAFNNGCGDSITVNVKVFPSIVADTVRATCFGKNDGRVEVTVSGGTPPYNYLWSNNKRTASIERLFPGTYTVTVTDVTGCTAQGTYIIPNPPELVIDSIVPRNIDCYTDNQGDIIVYARGGTPPYLYNSQVSSTITSLNTGTISVDVVDDNACSVSTTYTLASPAKPALSASYDAPERGAFVLKDFATVQFRASAPTGVNYLWDFGDGNISTDPNPVHTYTVADDYTPSVVVTDRFDCPVDTVLPTLKVLEQVEINVPNVFTPNGDGTNDEFLIPISAFQSFELEIYDRAGKIMFTATSPTQAWTGLYNGSPVAAGSYFYRLRVLLITGFETIRNGQVTVLR